MLVSEMLAYSLRVAGVIGVGQVPLAQDTTDAQTALQLMLQQWQRRRWLVHRLDEAWIKVTPGKASYTIGPATTAPAADIFYSNRPGTIETAFLRQLNGTGSTTQPVDYPLQQLMSHEEWSAVAMKSLKSWPGYFFYDPALPNGIIWILPIPNLNNFELHFGFAVDFINTGLTEELTQYVPHEYEEAVAYNLAARLRLNYGLPPSPEMAAIARASLATLRSNNFAMRPLQMPAALRRGGRVKNPNAGFVEVAASVPYTVVS